MDHDQFGGRTDDDLFSDDIEPVDELSSLPTAAEPLSEDALSQPEPAPPAPVQQPEPAAAPPPQAPRSSLAQSRHAPRQQDKPRHPPNNKPPQKPPNTITDTPPTQEPPASTASSRTSTPAVPTGPSANSTSSSSNNNSNNSNNNNKPPSNAPREPSSKNTASAVSAARLNSGANPRTKLTEEELAARMEKMRLLAAEKTRRFEEAQRDETEHAAAYARGMEEARRRRAEDAARRRVAEEERRRLEEERARNRERKLAAMGIKEDGWDQGKEVARDNRGLAAFRGAFGGVRGNRSGQGQGQGQGQGLGLGGSRFASSSPDGAEEYNGFVGRGRGGRGRGGKSARGGRGGRGLYEYEERDGGRDWDRGRDAVAAQEMRTGGPGQLAPKKTDLKAEDFPALPSFAAAPPKKLDTAWGAKSNNPMADIPLSPPVGKWDEEVAAMDDKTNMS
ncbi:hypothetical protein MFIFM68171_05664 [Madurella fahalii]|uniref:Uncharacterized protein n=1 Tax=Madurella fahalii TaxID=1157608 RepID=A0ABQ0GCK3_9PEZI